MSTIKNDIWPLNNRDLCFQFVAIAQTGYFGKKVPQVFFRINCFTRPAFQVWSVSIRVSEHMSAPSRPLFISNTRSRIVKNHKLSLAKRSKLLTQSREANSSLLRDFEFAWRLLKGDLYESNDTWDNFWQIDILFETLIDTGCSYNLLSERSR